MGPTARVVARALTWPIAPACVALIAAAEVAEPGSAGRLVTADDLPYLAALLATWIVGLVLTSRVPQQPAGWAFLGLGSALAASGVFNAYTELAVVGRDDLPAAELVATLNDTAWVWWFVFVALVIALTPPVRPTGRWLGRLPALTVLAGIVYQISALLRPTSLDPPYQDIVSPFALSGAAGDIASLVAAISVACVGLCVLGSAAILVLAWRRAEGETRQQLLWLAAGTLPLIPCVVGSFAVSYAGHSEIAGVWMSLAIICVAVGAALSVLRYRLYDVERVVTGSAGYIVAAAAVVAAFLAVLAVLRETTPADAGAQLPPVLATLAAVAVARSAYVWARRTAERRVNRSRFDAVETVRAGLSPGQPDLDVLLTSALADPTARILYPAADGAWVTTDGQLRAPDPACVDVHRHGVVTAKLEFDPARTDRAVVEAVAEAAAVEIDNVALRAELARQVDLISQSRARLATAHLDERRRLERDLHDGAQQRLLAIALQLQAARVNGSQPALIDEVDRAIADIGLTVHELRALAGGLQPAALAGGGLLAAVIDMVDRVPVRIEYDVIDRRFPAQVESAAWFVVSEAVTNIVKHASTDQATISVTYGTGVVQVRVADDGIGGADQAGHGLQGLADRVDALGGNLEVGENRPHGTVVQAELPCAS